MNLKFLDIVILVTALTIKFRCSLSLTNTSFSASNYDCGFSRAQNEDAFNCLSHRKRTQAYTRNCKEEPRKFFILSDKLSLKTCVSNKDTVHVIPLVLISLSVEDLGISVFSKDIVRIFTICYPRPYPDITMC